MGAIARTTRFGAIKERDVATPQPAYITELLRHFADLRDGAHGDAVSRHDKEQLFAEAVSLLDAYARQALNEINAHLLLGTGEVTATGVQSSESGGVDSVWSLSWPEQRATGINPDRHRCLLRLGIPPPAPAGRYRRRLAAQRLHQTAGGRRASHAARYRRRRPAQLGVPTRLPNRSGYDERTIVITPRD
jgi:hypothetical protein